MPGRLLSWPDWPEFTPSKAEPGDDLVGYKKAIVDKYGKDALVQSWLRVCKELESVTDSIAELGSSAIPEIQFQDIFALTPEQKAKLKDTGCFVVRNVFSEAQADEWFQNLKEYVAANRSSIGGTSFFEVQHPPQKGRGTFFWVNNGALQAGLLKRHSFSTCITHRPR